ncbi:zeta toxin family protein [Burkholderia stagnalis]|uniref:zeta toxin family protein n=1 Tax=Burkholderia stagnalis TaxID=1503054 RepID=UPI0021AB43BB|nr:zeta toxin family protein [Burkholderia stagnalis]
MARELNDADLDAIYRRVEQRAIEATLRQEQPVAILLGGQPGSGKAGLAGVAQRELRDRGGAVVIDADQMREFNPAYRALARADPERAADQTQALAGRWASRLTKRAEDERRNLIVDGTMRNPDNIAALAQRLQRAGYTVEARVMAVPPDPSFDRARLRYEQLAAEGQVGRVVNREQHDAAYRGLPATVARLERDGLADRIRIYDSHAREVYDGERDRNRDIARETAASGLLEALSVATRDTRWGPVPDPVANEVLGSKSVRALDRELASLGIRDLRPLAAGASSVVLDAKDRVVRVGVGESIPRPKVPEVLQAERTGAVGFLRYEILPKVDTRGITQADVQALQDSLQRRGYVWGDAAPDNIGRLEGRLVITDPGGISPANPTKEMNGDRQKPATGKERDIDASQSTSDAATTLESVRNRLLTHAERGAHIEILEEIVEHTRARNERTPGVGPQDLAEVSKRLQAAREDHAAFEHSEIYKRAKVFDDGPTVAALARYPEFDGAYRQLADVRKSWQSDTPLADRQQQYFDTLGRLSEQLHRGEIPGGNTTLAESERVMGVVARERNLMIRTPEPDRVLQGDVVGKTSQHALVQISENMVVMVERGKLDREINQGEKTALLHSEQGTTKVLTHDEARELQQNRQGMDLERSR